MLHKIYSSASIRIVRFSIVVLGFFCILLTGCNAQKQYYNLPTFKPNDVVLAVIEIPAGTNKKYEYDAVQNQFRLEQINGRDRIIDFLPYPGNYGFVPSTVAPLDKGGDGDALDILVLSEALKTGTVIETHPIALLRLIDDNEKDYKILAIPKDRDLQIIKARSFGQLQSEYPNLIRSLEIWFQNYNKNDSTVLEGWGDEQDALQEIRYSSTH